LETPNLRRRTVDLGTILFATVVLTLTVFVYLAVSDHLDDGVEEVLTGRLEVATEVVRELGPEEGAQRLTELGVPAVIQAPGGDAISAEPLTPRFGVAPPAPGNVLEPRVSTTAALEDGTVVEVFATRAGVERTLQRLLLVMTVGGLLAVVFVHLLLRRLVHEVMTPLEQVVETAENITAGSDERLSPSDPSTELGRMACAFDLMVDSLEDAAKQADDERERMHRFLADAAHQLRTPIAGIRGAVELLLRDVDPETRDELLTHAVRETARASKLLTALLHMARLDQGRPPQLMPTDLVKLCHVEVERVRDRAPNLDIALVDEVSGSPTASIDPSEVDEAIANLLDNARRHAEERIEVRISRDGPMMTVRVRDDGPGVRPGAEELIFERFATLDGAGGSGLGLAIARAVARAHGGDLIYEGGAFILRVPREDAA
jgi:two-component system, OmpR family, sensor kinase